MSWIWRSICGCCRCFRSPASSQGPSRCPPSSFLRARHRPNKFSRTQTRATVAPAESHPGPLIRTRSASLHARLHSVTLQSLKEESKTDPAARFGLHLEAHPCKVVKVYDGDSLTLAWPRTGPWDTKLCYANARLYGIDTPELRGTRGEEHERAEACRDMLAGMALGQLFLFTTQGPTGLDKYGRPLIVLTAKRGWTAPHVCDAVEPYESLNAWALKVLPGCVPYFGGTKVQSKEDGVPRAESRAGERSEAGP